MPSPAPRSRQQAQSLVPRFVGHVTSVSQTRKILGSVSPPTAPPGVATMEGPFLEWGVRRRQATHAPTHTAHCHRHGSSFSDMGTGAVHQPVHTSFAWDPQVPPLCSPGPGLSRQAPPGLPPLRLPPSSTHHTTGAPADLHSLPAPDRHCPPVFSTITP